MSGEPEEAAQPLVGGGQILPLLLLPPAVSAGGDPLEGGGQARHLLPELESDPFPALGRPPPPPAR